MTKSLIFLASISLFFIFSSCSGLIATDRTFITEMDKDTDGFFVPDKDFNISSGDAGEKARNKREIMDRTPLEGKEKTSFKQELALEEELKDLEDSLTDAEYNHFLSYRDYLPTISDKIYFLKLKNINERNRYLGGRGVRLTQGSRGQDFDKEFAATGKEIYVGMSKDAVVRSWGRPVRVDVAGNPNHENERWMFNENGRSKYVFFEYGQVKGWEQDVE